MSIFNTYRSIVAKDILWGDHLGGYFCTLRNGARMCIFPQVEGRERLLILGFSGPYESFGLRGAINLTEPE